MNEETRLQNVILRALCHLPGVVAWRCNTARRGNVAFGLRDLQGSVAGTPDIIGIASGLFLAVEVKLPGQLCTPAQEARLEQVRRLGGIALVGRDVRQVVETVQQRQRELGAFSVATKDQAWERFLARLEAGEFSVQRAPLVAFNAGYEAGLLDAEKLSASPARASDEHDTP